MCFEMSLEKFASSFEHYNCFYKMQFLNFGVLSEIIKHLRNVHVFPFLLKLNAFGKHVFIHAFYHKKSRKKWLAIFIASKLYQLIILLFMKIMFHLFK